MKNSAALLLAAFLFPVLGCQNGGGGSFLQADRIPPPKTFAAGRPDNYYSRATPLAQNDRDSERPLALDRRSSPDGGDSLNRVADRRGRSGASNADSNDLQWRAPSANARKRFTPVDDSRDLRADPEFDKTIRVVDGAGSGSSPRPRLNGIRPVDATRTTSRSDRESSARRRSTNTRGDYGAPSTSDWRRRDEGEMSERP